MSAIIEQQTRLAPFPLLADPQKYCAFTFNYFENSSRYTSRSRHLQATRPLAGITNHSSRSLNIVPVLLFKQGPQQSSRLQNMDRGVQEEHTDIQNACSNRQHDT